MCNYLSCLYRSADLTSICNHFFGNFLNQYKFSFFGLIIHLCDYDSEIVGAWSGFVGGSLAFKNIWHHTSSFTWLTISRFTITRKQKLLVGLGSATACRSWRLCRRIKATVQRRLAAMSNLGRRRHPWGCIIHQDQARVGAHIILLVEVHIMYTNLMMWLASGPDYTKCMSE